MSSRHNRKRQAETLSDNEDAAQPATPGGGMNFPPSSPGRIGMDGPLPPSSPPASSPFMGYSRYGDGDDDEIDGLDDDLPERLEDAELRDDEGEMLALEEDDDGEDLFGPGMESDYRHNAQLDRYDADMLDDTDFGSMDPAERARVEARLRRRDFEEGRGQPKSRIPLAFMQDFEDADDARFSRSGRRAAGG
ncbi:MCM DNA helicase complex subunit, partial [Kickxella alabastrina]